MKIKIEKKMHYQLKLNGEIKNNKKVEKKITNQRIKIKLKTSIHDKKKTCKILQHVFYIKNV